jgi:hypothetical protein
MADKLISQLTAAATNLQDVDLAELQVNGEVFSRKMTGAQLRAVEKGERMAQDDVIEAGAGLNANGTFTAPANSWNLRAVDFLAGCTDRGGATGALTENIYNALRLLDAKVTAAGAGNIVVLQANLSVDTTLTNIVPAGYMLSYVIFNEKAGFEGTLDLGTTAGGNQVFINQTITASTLTTIIVNRVFSLAAATTLYLNDDTAPSAWNGSISDVYFVLTPIIPGGTAVDNTVIVGYYAGAYGFMAIPTAAQITAIIGVPTLYNAGSVFLINDTLGDTYLVESNGVNWFVNSATFTQAL